jgi:putative IMPACT (imprinted ancient) family translation regulator
LSAAHLELAAIKNALADVMRERDEAQRAHVRVQYENLTHRASHEALERLVESATDRWDPELHAYVLRVSKDQWEHVKALLGDVVSGPKLNL